jgi:hypothetical protein
MLIEGKKKKNENSFNNKKIVVEYPPMTASITIQDVHHMMTTYQPKNFIKIPKLLNTIHQRRKALRRKLE